MTRDTIDVREVVCCARFVSLPRQPDNDGNAWQGQCPRCRGVWRIALVDPPPEKTTKVSK